jgi:hypothetical protein
VSRLFVAQCKEAVQSRFVAVRPIRIGGNRASHFKRAAPALILILHPRKFVIGKQIGSASIPIIVSIVVVSMMVPLPLVFVGVTVVAVAVFAVVVRSVWLVSGANVNAKAIVCFGLGGYQGNQPERRQTHEEISFHMIPFLG